MITGKLDVSIHVPTAGADFYFILPSKCVVTDVQLAVGSDPGDGDTVTVTSGGVAIGVVAFGSGVTAGDIGTYTSDATTGDTVLAAGATLKFVVTALADGDTAMGGYIEIDQYARTTLA